ncbi:MAG: protein kinase [Chloroflexi bacterium]|nr:protein kinase [Chloroflexota bacterium]
MTERQEGLVGKTLGKYDVLEYLGYGAVAQVYKAYHPVLDRNVAIKLLHPHFTREEDFVERFKIEARNLASLRHPNIVQVYDFDIYGKRPYMVMEYINGPTLKHLIEDARKRQVRVPLGASIRMIQNIGVGLSYAHGRNIAHRDIKPSNVLIERSGRVVLADFGLARLLSGKKQTVPGTLTGTPAYISPEQAMGKSGEGASDIYSLGVVFYELVTGQLPYDAEHQLAIAMKHVNEPFPSPRLIYPELPDQIAQIIQKAMAKTKEERYQSIDLLLQDLVKFQPTIKTARLQNSSLIDIANVSTKQESTGATTRLPSDERTQVSVYFIDTGQILNLKTQAEYTIGRKYKGQPLIPDIDLTPFKGYEWGISRLHAKVVVGDEDVSISDLGSSNGTWHSGRKLRVNTPYKLNHGDIILLGKLRLQFLIYK